MKMNKFWAVKAEAKKARLDLFGYVGGSKDWGGFNEEEFLKDFRQIDPESELEISINSFGGAVYTGLSIYSLLKSHKGPITIRVDGAAMSAATIITSAPNAKVIMPKGSMMMIHKVSSIAIGTTDDLRKTADDMEKLEENLISIYMEKTGKTREEIKEKVDAETYFTAQEAVDFGLADEIDEATTVNNVAAGEFVNVNGLQVDAKIFANAPEGFLKKAEPTKTATAEEEEVSEMNLEKLKAEYPDLVEAIRSEAITEGATKERERILAIEAIAKPGHEALVESAKNDVTMTDEKLAVAILKAEKVKASNMLEARKQDAQELEGTGNVEGNQGVDPQAEAKAKQEAEEKAWYEASRKAFERK